jgi:hypothetical protein
MLTRRVVRAGSGLLVAVAAIALVAILAAAAIPILSGYNDLQKAADTDSIFQSLRYSLVNNTAAIGNDGWNDAVGNNKLPSRLSYLTEGIVGNTSTKCQGGTFATGDATTVRKQGPFSGLFITAGSGAGSGLRTPLGTMIKDTVLPNAFIPGVSSGRVAIGMDSVSDNDRNNLDLLIDNSDGATAGTFRWKASVGGAGYNYVVFTVTVAGCP